jgi:hypothetical protein
VKANASQKFLLALISVCATALTLHAELVNGVKAVVHTSVITRGEIESDVLMVAEEYRRQYGRQPELYNQKIEAAFQESLQQSIERHLMLRDFVTAGYNLPESVIEEVVFIRKRSSRPTRSRPTTTNIRTNIRSRNR